MIDLKCGYHAPSYQINIVVHFQMNTLRLYLNHFMSYSMKIINLIKSYHYEYDVKYNTYKLYPIKAKFKKEKFKT